MIVKKMTEVREKGWYIYFDSYPSPTKGWLCQFDGEHWRDEVGCMDVGPFDDTDFCIGVISERKVLPLP